MKFTFSGILLFFSLPACACEVFFYWRGFSLTFICCALNEILNVGFKCDRMSDDLLDCLLSVAADELNSTEVIPKPKLVNNENEDERFLEKISTTEPFLKSPKLNLQPQEINKLDSVVHTGDTDSSDDESNKYFEKYNDFGKSIKHSLSLLGAASEQKNDATWKVKKDNSKQLTLPAKLTPNSDVYTDPIFGIRIVNPLISSTVLKDRMTGREAVPMIRLKRHVSNLKSGQDWVIGGVIVHKSASKTSQKGSQFSIWTLSDLQNDLKTVTLFIFGNAYKQLWKTVTGTVVGVLNPAVLEKREGSKEEATLSVDNAQRVMILGQSKDLGTCKTVKKNGEQCTAFVNVNRCEFCIYHVKQEYQKCSKRSELQSNFSGRGLTALRNKVLGKNEVFYAGKSYMAIPAKKSKKFSAKDELILKSLSGVASINENHNVKGKNLNRKKKAATNLELSHKQRAKDLELLKKLGVHSDLKRDSNKVDFKASLSSDVTAHESKNVALNVITKLKAARINTPIAQYNQQDLVINSEQKETFNRKLSTEVTLKESKSVALDVISKLNAKKRDANGVELNFEKEDTKLKATQKSMVEASVPLLSGFNAKEVDLNSPILKRHVSRAKVNALNWVQKNGTIKKSNPMNTKGTGKKRPVEVEIENDPKRQKIQENEFFSDRFKKMMAASSKHTDLLDERDDDEQEKYFKKLETKERMEEKMSSTYKLECKAVRCLKCKYTNFSASDRCKSEKHPLKVFDAVKRFFKCGNCGNRTVTLDVVPTIACKNCKDLKWERTAMMKEKKAGDLHVLSIRGGEQKYVNSVMSNGNLNLMMPDDV